MTAISRDMAGTLLDGIDEERFGEWIGVPARAMLGTPPDDEEGVRQRRERFELDRCLGVEDPEGRIGAAEGRLDGLPFACTIHPSGCAPVVGAGRIPMDNQNVTPVDEQRSQLREYLGILRFRKWSLILVTLIVVGAVIAWSARQTPKYEAESRVFVEAVAISGTDQRAPSVNLDTEREILSSSTVIAEGVVEKLDLPYQPHQLLRNLSVEVIHRTEVLSIKFQSPSPELARGGANAFARGYLAQRKQQVLDDIAAAQASLQEQIEDLNPRLRAARVEAVAAPEDSIEKTEKEA
jgi:capsular polysaccharide biosynthesis protein